MTQIVFSIIGLLFGGIIYVLVLLVWLILLVIARWMVFAKAGEPGWKSLIPIYNTYTSYKIAWTSDMFWLSLIFSFLSSFLRSMGGDGFSIMAMLGGICSIVTVVITFMYCLNLAKSFGKGLLFGIGLWLFEPVFMMILGLGSARYQERRHY